MTKYISTTLPYINSKPHIGHTFEFVLADIIARFHRTFQNVHFVTGIDEHGIKVQQAAEKEGIPVRDYCDRLAEEWKYFCFQFDISAVGFYRTSSQAHAEKVKTFFITTPCKFFTKKLYEGKYCIGCETFVTEKEIVDGNKCPIHLSELENIKEENWFFNLAYFRDGIKDNLVNKKLSKELANIKENFDEISITRQNVKWGVEFDETSTFYVWYEALLNYIFAAGWTGKKADEENFIKHWENSLIICGPDNLKFQAYVLPAILLAGGVQPPKQVLVHGNILDADGVKMSKTLGNVIDPIEQLNKFGVSPVRFYLFFGLNIYDSSSYSEAALINLWNSEVCNNFGNLIARVFHLIDIKKVDITEGGLSEKFIDSLRTKETILHNLFQEYKFTPFKDFLFSYISDVNKKINDTKPYAKESTNAAEVLNELYYELKLYAKYFSLVIPEYAKLIEEAFAEKKKVVLFKRLEF